MTDDGASLMRRFIIFALAGPPLGMLVSIFIVIPLVALLDGTAFEPSFAQVETFLALVPFSYIIGIIPAVLTSLADWAVRDVRTPLRILCVTAAGYVFEFLPFWWPLTGRRGTNRSGPTDSPARSLERLALGSPLSALDKRAVSDRAGNAPRGFFH